MLGYAFRFFHLRSAIISTTTKPSRRLATSAQKRKWKGKAMKKPSLKKKPLAIEEKANSESTITKPSTGMNWRPLVFLGIFPLFMSTLVVLSREDLLQNLQQKGIGEAARGIRDLRTQRALDQEEKERQRDQQEQQPQ